MDRRHRRPWPQGFACSAHRSRPIYSPLAPPTGPVGEETSGTQGLTQPGRRGRGAQTHRRDLVSDDGSLDIVRRNRRTVEPKIGKIISQVGSKALKNLGKTRKDLRHQMKELLKARV